MSRSASDVSVISINWNGREHLEHLLPSVLTLEPGEVIVVDNGSSDGSQAYLESFGARVRLLRNPQNEGFAQPCNLAAEAARRPVLAFINNDMRAHPNWLSAALPLLGPETPCVGSRILDWSGEKVDFNGSSLQHLGYALQRDVGQLAAEVTYHGDRMLFPCGGAALFDREVFLEQGGFDADFFAIYEDVDLGWRLWTAGYEVAYAPDSLTYHRGHATFRQRPNEKLRFLMHRNALLTALKNYEESTFRKILPLALVMGVKRAVLFSGVQREGFHLWDETRHGLAWGDTQVQDRVLDSINHLVALDEVLDTLPRTLEKRERIQGRRRRTDAEIVKWFVDPLRSIVMQADYRQQEGRWLELLDLTQLLGVPETEWRRPRQQQLDATLKRLDRELQAKLWIAGRTLVNPPAPLTAGLGRRLRQLWRMGAPAAWRRFQDIVNRGI